MTGDQVQLLVSFGACGVAIPIIVVGWMREKGFGQGRPEPQRKADESLARVNTAPRPRLGIDVYPVSCPVRLEEPVERVCDVIQGRAA